MDKAKMGNIAILIVKNRLLREGIHLGSFSRDAGNLSRETGVPKEQLEEFMKIMVQSVVDGSLKKGVISLSGAK